MTAPRPMSVRRIADNLAAVRASVADACREAGRDPAGVRIIGVTKYVGIDEAMAVYECGCRDLAESRPQELWRKAEAFATAGLQARWHLIGHLQRNKVRRTLPHLHLLHSLDSLRLLRTIDEEARVAGIIADVLVEVKVDDGPQRTGASRDEVSAIVTAASELPGIRLRGMMAMASAPDDGDDPVAAARSARRQFAAVRELRDELRIGMPADSLAELSMGMSGDYREAILEGATIVRVGSALFRQDEGPISSDSRPIL